MPPVGRPPRLTEALLHLVVADGLVGRSIVGDLGEEYVFRARLDGVRRARWWYRRNAAGLIVRRLWARIRDGADWANRSGSLDTVGGRKGDLIMRQWVTQLAHATRSLARVRGFTSVTVLTLALAIGANATIFSVVKAVLLDALPYVEPSQLVAIKSTTPGNNTPPEFGVSPEFYAHYRDVPGLRELALYSGFGGTLEIDGVAERVRGAEVTHDLFETLGVTPVLGRLPSLDDVRGSGSPTEQQEAAAEVVVVSHAFWMQSLGGDPGVIGRTVELNDRLRTIIAVVPPDLRLPENETAIWVPFQVDPDDLQIGNFRWSLLGRLAEGVEPEDLESQLAPVAARLPEIYDGSSNYVAFMVDGQYRPIVRSLAEELVGDLEQPLWILLGTVGFVLLIACANVANLFLVRAESRQREMAVRAAMGAGRARLVRAHLAEAFVLAIAGGLVGSGLAWVGVPLLVQAAPSGIPRIDTVRLDVPVLAFTAALSLVSAILIGLGAALRYSSPSLLHQLRTAGRGAIGRRDRHAVRNALVVAQSCLALVLLVGAGLLVKSFAELKGTDPGYDTRDILTFQVALPFESYSSPMAMADFHISMMERLAALPGVQAVGAVDALPLDESASGTAIEFEGAAGPATGAASIVYYTYAAPGYFETMGISLQAGRTFVRADQESDLGNVVISRSLAERAWPGKDPIGRRIRMAGDDTGWDTVVGVVEDVRDRELGEASRGMVYYPLVGRNGDDDWFVSSPAYVIRSENAASLGPAVRYEIRRRDPGLPVYRMQTMQEVVADSVERLSFTMLALGISAVMALVLGAVGLYGVLSYLVSQRTQEIGVRLALGAERYQVRRMVVGQGAKLALLGLGVGLLASAWLTRLLQDLLYGTEPLDVMTFGGMSAVMLLVGLLASYVPARRASSVDPLESMQAE